MAPTAARSRVGTSRIASRRQARLLQALAHRLRDGARGAEALRAAAQDRGIAGLEAERARIRRHVRAALEDDADDAERRRDALDRQAVRPLERGEHAADRIGQRGDALDGRRPWLRGARGSSVSRSMNAALCPLAPRIRQVVGVGGEDRPARRARMRVGHGAQSARSSPRRSRVPARCAARARARPRSAISASHVLPPSHRPSVHPIASTCSMSTLRPVAAHWRPASAMSSRWTISARPG